MVDRVSVKARLGLLEDDLAVQAGINELVKEIYELLEERVTVLEGSPTAPLEETLESCQLPAGGE